MTPTPRRLVPPVLAVLAALAASAGAASALLALGSRPPLFSLANGLGQPVALKTFLGKAPVLLVLGPSNALLAEAQARRAGLVERDMVLIGTKTEKIGTGFSSGPVVLLRDPDGAVARVYRADPSGSVSYLIGKDGTIKAARRGTFAFDDVYGLVDAMPMRQQEMNPGR